MLRKQRIVPDDHPWKQPRPYRRKTIAQSFWEKVKKTNTCWLWTASTFPSGYGQLSENSAGTSHLAHRISWQLHFGTIPNGLCVLHRCDVRNCVNPDHLFLGSHADNSNDAVAKGRTARGIKHGSKTHPEALKRGSSHGNAKLNESQVAQILKLHAEGVTQCSLATMFGVSSYPIHAIVHRKGWKHVSIRE